MKTDYDTYVFSVQFTETIFSLDAEYNYLPFNQPVLVKISSNAVTSYSNSTAYFCDLDSVQSPAVWLNGRSLACNLTVVRETADYDLLTSPESMSAMMMTIDPYIKWFRVISEDGSFDSNYISFFAIEQPEIISFSPLCVFSSNSNSVLRLQVCTFPVITCFIFDYRVYPLTMFLLTLSVARQRTCSL